MKIIDLQCESVTLNDVIELAREDPVSILTDQGEELYVTRLGSQPTTVSGAETQGSGEDTITRQEVEQIMEEELARFEGRPFTGKD